MVILNFKEDFDYNSKEPKFCAWGEYNNKKILVIYNGCHPCAYVESNTDLYHEHNNKSKYDIPDCPAHYGFTWYGPLYHWAKTFKDIDPKIFNKNYLGWDYGHLTDYSRLYADGFLEMDENNPLEKWTVDSIIDCIVNTIDWMHENGID